MFIQSRIVSNPLFEMSLSPRHLKEFESKKFVCTGILQNIPQLITQIMFIIATQIHNGITIIALITSITALLMSAIHSCSTTKILETSDIS